jgi:GH43 family beta-xylosidase
MLAEPEFDWETSDSAVLEGPYGLKSPDGTVYMVYSANSCSTPAYTLGALRFKAGGDPMDRESWAKLSEPLFRTGNGLYGPAHNAFFKSPDGTEDWQVFHANQNQNDGCSTTRETFIQRISWKDDVPDLGEPLAVGTEIFPPAGE